MEKYIGVNFLIETCYKIRDEEDEGLARLISYLEEYRDSSNNAGYEGLNPKGPAYLWDIY